MPWGQMHEIHTGARGAAAVRACWRAYHNQEIVGTQLTFLPVCVRVCLFMFMRVRTFVGRRLCVVSCQEEPEMPEIERSLIERSPSVKFGRRHTSE